MNSREFSLLLSCATSQPDAGRIKEAIQRGICWPTLLALAQKHGVRPILCQNLKSVCWDSIPETFRRHLECSHRVNAQVSLLYVAELLRLLTLFQEKGIRLAAFKGPILGQSLYGDISLREISDLDLIVHEVDVSKAEGILTSQ